MYILASIVIVIFLTFDMFIGMKVNSPFPLGIITSLSVDEEFATYMARWKAWAFKKADGVSKLLGIAPKSKME